MAEPDYTDPSFTFTARAGWVRAVTITIVERLPIVRSFLMSFGGWALAGYLIVGVGQTMKENVEKNTATLAAVVDLLGQQGARIETNNATLLLHEKSGNDYRLESLRMSFMGCLNTADDVVKTQRCFAQAPDWLADEIRRWRPSTSDTNK